MESINRKTTHSIPLGYFLWFFGFTGAHRFYYGRTKTGVLYFLTFGLFLIGWIYDFFQIPDMENSSNRRYQSGKYNYSIAWILLTYLGIFGVHRFYLGKWITGTLWLCTGGFFFIGLLYDFCYMNEIVAEQNLLS